LAERDATRSLATVLIVDDDEAFRRSTARILASHRYWCLEAGSSGEARDVLDAEQDVAAVLCDIRMPGRSGMDLLAELTADFPDLAVVMTTGSDDPHVAEVAFDFGAFGYLIKPFEANELLINLASALRRRDLESPSESTSRRWSRRSPVPGSSGGSSRASTASGARRSAATRR
jgi:putative two-component system response regulator